MKKRVIDKFSDYEFKFSLGRDFFIDNIDFFHPKPMFLLTLVFLTLVSLFKPQAFTILIPLVFVYFYLSFQLKKTNQHLKLIRKFPTKTKEENTEVFEHKIINKSPFGINNLVLFDYFDGHKDSQHSLVYKKFHYFLGPNMVYSEKRNVVLNNGMGQKVLGPCSFQLTDAIGIHKLEINMAQKHEVTVYPKVHQTKSPKLRPSNSEVNYGQFDTQVRGTNINFYCAKEYRQGDNIKHINWKLSLKSNKIIINQFENNTNAFVHILLIDDQRVHFGSGSLNSFEYCKDLLLSFCNANIRSNNSIGLISHQKTIKAKTSSSHLKHLEICVSKLEQKSFGSNSVYTRKKAALAEIELLKKKVLFECSKSNELYIFSGFIDGKVWDLYFEMFTQISRRNLNIHLVIPFGYKKVSTQVGELDNIWINKINYELPKRIKELVSTCHKLGLKISLIDMDSNKQYKEIIKDGFKHETI